MISIIVAMDKNRVIGKNNQLPWHLPADLAHFKQVTMGKPIVMGRKTYHSIGKPLPGRRNIVISHQDLNIVGVEIFNSLENAIQNLLYEKEIMIIGGAMIFQQALAWADKIYLTVIEHDFVGDAFFPTWPKNEWQEISREQHRVDEKNRYDYSFIELVRIR